MNRTLLLGAALAGAVLVSPASAKKPAAADEAAIRAMIEKLYEPYSKPYPEPPEDGSYAPENAPGSAIDGGELPYTKSLGPLIAQWGDLMHKAEQVYMLNDFDWYCQCQDSDPHTAGIISQSYKLVAKDRIDANIMFSPASYEGRDHGRPLLFRFKREDGAWKLDDLKFDHFSTLRKALAQDIKDVTRDLAKGIPQ